MTGSYVYALGVLEPKDCITKFNPHDWYSPAKLTAKIIINLWNKNTNIEWKTFLLEKLHETAKYESKNTLHCWFLGEANLLCVLYNELAKAEIRHASDEEIDELKNDFIEDNVLHDPNFKNVPW